MSDITQGQTSAPEPFPVGADPVPEPVETAMPPVEDPPMADSVDPAPAPVVEEPVEIDPVAAALEAPGHAVGDVIEGAERGHTVGFFPCGVDKLGRVWRIEEGDDGDRLVLAGRLQT